MKNRTFIWFVTAATLLFCLAIGVDLSPYLRGPSYYPPEWRWEYWFENTLGRIYAPLLVIGAIAIVYRWVEKKKTITRTSLVLFFAATILLFFCLQFAVLYFSRSGIGVVIHRIINPELNGYFTAALTITSLPEFLRNYNTLMLDFVYHAKAHPPGAILFFYYIDQLMQFFPALGNWAMQQVPSRPDVLADWQPLVASQKATVFASALIIPLLSGFSMIPLFFTAKLLYGVKTALRSVFVLAVIPSLLFFIPINDAFLHVFTITAFCFFVYGLRNNSPLLLVGAGATIFLGVFFNLSLLPVLVLFFAYFLLHEYTLLKKQFVTFFKKGLYFLLGLFFPFLLLFVVFQFNFIMMTATIMKYVPDVHTRSYLIWIVYNLYDFFIFAGIPVLIVYFMAIKNMVGIVIKKSVKHADLLLIAFTLMIVIVNFSGSVRGETGRIWIPYIPFLVLIVTGFMTKTLHLSTKQFVIIVGLQALQLLVMQEFWVMLW